MYSNIEKIKSAIQDEINTLGNKMVDAPWHDPEFYKMWLAQTHYLIRHTTKLLALAAAYVKVENRDHHYVMLEHIKGELHHDLMPLKDLKDFGAHISEFPELPETEMIHQLQYYWIAHENPLSLCGYAFLLEGAAKFFGPQLLKNLQEKYGSKGSLFLKVHVTVDQDHYEEGSQFLNTLNLEECRYILRNMQQSNILYSRMIDRVKDEYLLQKKYAA